MSLNFNYIDVKTELVKELRNHINDNIRILKSDPREVTEIPCIGINRAGDDEQSQVLGDELGIVFDESLGFHVSYKGTFFSETMEIRVWHSNADERDALYILTKAVLINLRDFLIEKGLRNLKLSGGRDEQENNFPPHPLYWAAINLNYLNPLDITVVLDDKSIIEEIDAYKISYGKNISSSDILSIILDDIVL